MSAFTLNSQKDAPTLPAMSVPMQVISAPSGILIGVLDDIEPFCGLLLDGGVGVGSLRCVISIFVQYVISDQTKANHRKQSQPHEPRTNSASIFFNGFCLLNFIIIIHAVHKSL